MIDAVRETGLLAASRPVLVMLSGGRDSVCLLDLAVRIAGADAVSALHVNYGLRDASDADELHCALLCERLGVPLEIRRPRRPERGNVQAWARDVRYAAAAELAGEGDIAAGHTATDQVETILYRLASSPSRRALLGMKPREGRLVRPLLNFARAYGRVLPRAGTGLARGRDQRARCLRPRPRPSGAGAGPEADPPRRGAERAFAGRAPARGGRSAGRAGRRRPRRP